ncbi:hypothetical protein E2C01_006872 [Portunus trituberculatus]|uniref:Uncharacterized protein n=1 Tax=Portunus trituberculatus TaxID=210409 RepID=A0A5B7CXG5_PORTR|nr:hypothetical protein [Portunus trituberculatus]
MVRRGDRGQYHVTETPEGCSNPDDVPQGFGEAHTSPHRLSLPPPPPLPPAFIPGRTTRQAGAGDQKMVVPRFRSSQHQLTFKTRAVSQWNHFTVATPMVMDVYASDESGCQCLVL